MHEAANALHNFVPRQDTEQELQQLDLVLHSEHQRCSADEVRQTAVGMDSFRPKVLVLSPKICEGSLPLRLINWVQALTLDL